MSQKRVYLFGNGKAEGNAKMREEQSQPIVVTSTIR